MTTSCVGAGISATCAVAGCNPTVSGTRLLVEPIEAQFEQALIVPLPLGYGEQSLVHT